MNDDGMPYRERLEVPPFREFLQEYLESDNVSWLLDRLAEVYKTNDWIGFRDLLDDEYETWCTEVWGG